MIDSGDAAGGWYVRVTGSRSASAASTSSCEAPKAKPSPPPLPALPPPAPPAHPLRARAALAAIARGASFLVMVGHPCRRGFTGVHRRTRVHRAPTLRDHAVVIRLRLRVTNVR